MSGEVIRAGFIPLVDAAVLIAAADRGFAEEEGLVLELVREVSWSNIRDKLKLGYFDAAHLLAPLAIAETLGLDYAKVPMAVPLALNLNGNSIIVSTALHHDLAAAADGDLTDPAVTGAALKRVIAARRAKGAEPLAFGMTFPYSTHNYQLRYWMAAAGIDPDRDLRLVVVPPPYMVESLREGHVQGFCVGAPWPSMAVEAGLGTILHLGTDIFASCPEKVLALRGGFAEGRGEALLALTRALIRAAGWCGRAENRAELAQLLSVPGRVGVAPDILRRVLDGELRVDAQGRVRTHPRYLVIETAAARPDPRQALWLYAQMVRWGQASFSPEQAAACMATYRPDLFDAALHSMVTGPAPADGIGAFAGPAFDPADIPAYVAELGTAGRAPLPNS